MKCKRLTRARARRRLALRLALLALPVLFWSAVFMTVAGLQPLRRVVEAVPDAVQTAVALACPPLAVAVGAAAVRQERFEVDGGVPPGRLTVAAGAALFAFAVLVSLRAA